MCKAVTSRIDELGCGACIARIYLHAERTLQSRGIARARPDVNDQLARRQPPSCALRQQLFRTTIYGMPRLWENTRTTGGATASQILSRAPPDQSQQGGTRQDTPHRPIMFALVHQQRHGPLPL